MSQRFSFLPLAAAIPFLASTIHPAAAYVDRGEFVADLPRQRLDPLPSAAIVHVPEPALSKSSSPKIRLAHAKIVRTSPEQGSVAPEAIGKVEVWYDAGIRNEFAALAVINAAGDRVDKHDAAIDGFDQSHVSVSVEALKPGEYTVRYRAISADGHQVSGAWGFEVHGQ
jgi:copper resistance protein C